MDARPARLSEAEVEAALDGLHAWVTDFMRSDLVMNGWPVDSGSPLDCDNLATAPHQTAHSASAFLNASLDHLHALTFLVAQHRMLHVKAPFSLARAAMENAAAAHWLVAPEEGRERILRTLRLHVTDVTDAANARDDLGATMRVTREERMAELGQLALAAGIDQPVNRWRPFAATAALRSVDEAIGAAIKPGPLGAWRLFSGLAHGRGWATTGFLDQEATPGEGGVQKVRNSSTPEKVLFAASIAQDVFLVASNAYRARASAPS